MVAGVVSAGLVTESRGAQLKVVWESHGKEAVLNAHPHP